MYWCRRPRVLEAAACHGNHSATTISCATLAALSSAAIMYLQHPPASGSGARGVPAAEAVPIAPVQKGGKLDAQSQHNSTWRPLPRTVAEAATSIGAEMLGMDLGLASSNRGGKILPEDSALLRQALRERRVVRVPDTVLDGAPAFERICRVFGDSLQPVSASGNAVQLYIVQNRNSAAEAKRPSDEWHSDLSYLARPASATVLYAIEVPKDVDGQSQGDTLFVDMVAAYEALPADRQQRLCRMRGLHRHPSASDSQNPQLRPGQSDVTSHPMVVQTQAYRDAQTSVARALFINPAYTFGIRNEDGSIVEDEEQLLHDLVTHCLQPQFMLRLRWKVGALVVWDNSALWHRATTLEMAPAAHKQRRVMFRASVLCDSPL